MYPTIISSNTSEIIFHLECYNFTWFKFLVDFKNQEKKKKVVNHFKGYWETLILICQDCVATQFMMFLLKKNNSYEIVQ